MNVKNKRKTKYAICLIISLMLFSALFIVIGEINSNKVSNTKETNASISVEAPQFSKESGFYSEPFYLMISVPKGTKVYYTLDSSDPDENSIEYTEPIYLENATKNENVYSMRTDVSTGFYSDLIKKYASLDVDPNYKTPDYLIDKCNVVRAVAVDKYGNKSDIETKSYFVDISPQNYDNCNIITITTAPDNLFDYENGIYVTGKTFDDYYKTHKYGNWWLNWKANYKQKGKDWQRSANVTFLDKNGIYEFSNNANISVQGGYSRGGLPKSINIYLDSSDNRLVSYDLFNNNYFPISLTLFCGGNQVITQFNDIMIAERTSSLLFSHMCFKPYVMFLDGEYWGFYWLTSKYDENYISYVYNVEKEDVVMIKNGSIEVGDKSYIEEYNSLKKLAQNSDMTDVDNYNAFCELVDIDSFIDYYATQIYIARNADWPNGNFALWRTKNDTGKGYSDGKWRWMIFDSNSKSMGIQYIEHNTLELAIKNDVIFAALWDNDNFQNTFKRRILEIADECFAPEDMEKYIDDYTKEMYPIMSKSWKRFYGKNNNKSEEYFETMNSYKEFFDNRKAVVESWFDKE